MDNRRIVFATGNKDKMVEIKMILEDLHLPVISMKDAGIRIDVEENGSSYSENAMIKAKAVHELLPNDIILADDSGFEVDYLNKEPGIYSARYMGEDTSYDIKNNNLIDRMAGVDGEKRSARFVCAIVAILPDGEVQISEATMEGKIAYKIEGENGFGYDPILWLDDYECTSAQLTTEQKNKISHRGKALREARKKLLSSL